MAEFPDMSGRTLVGFFRLVVEPMEDPPNAPAHTTANTAGAAYQTKWRRVDFMYAVFHLHTRKASHWYVPFYWPVLRRGKRYVRIKGDGAYRGPGFSPGCRILQGRQTVGRRKNALVITGKAMKLQILVASSLILLAACTADDGASNSVKDGGTFDAISAGEVIHYTGTEPFWGGASGAGMATYSTPENPDGSEFPVERFAGNNGLGISGSLNGASFDLMITPGECSDGMSDRIFPYTATLLVGGEQRQGCAWTDSQPFSGPEAP